MKRKHVWLSVCLLVLTMAATVRADVRLPAVFADHMVLQRETEVPVWGWANAGETVSVEIAGQKKTAASDESGKWKLSLDSMPAGGPYEMTVSGKNSLTLQDVLVGEVWLCSGQSNMAFSLNGAEGGQEEIDLPEDPELRLFFVQQDTSQTPLEDTTEGHWSLSTPDAKRYASAVGYFFGKRLREELGVPVALIKSSVGGTPADSWTSREALQAGFEPILDRYTQAVPENYEVAYAKYQDDVAAWRLADQEARAAGKERPAKIREPVGPNNKQAPVGLFNGMIHPLIPYAIRGAIWYQGEANAGRADQYSRLLPAMITDWRARWGYDFPFGVVQLVNFYERKDEPGEASAWAELREAQVKTIATVPNAGLAVGIDVGEANNIHPKDKKTIGNRLAPWAFATVYGKDIEYSGPVYREMKKESNKIRLFFDHVGGGLVVKNADQLKRFAITGEDKVFHWADARIDGDTIVVSSEAVPDPVAVRYAWGNNPEATLYNQAGLPASPFRTDDWPGITTGRE
ncbi:sialate O-acetylesterase [bacterium]|nr:sialate O-acetylesterase [bacterium]